MTYKTLYRIKKIPHIPDERRFGIVDFSVINLAIARPIDIPELFPADWTLDKLKEHVNELMGEDKEIQRLEDYELVDVTLTVVSEDSIKMIE